MELMNKSKIASHISTVTHKLNADFQFKDPTMEFVLIKLMHKTFAVVSMFSIILCVGILLHVVLFSISLIKYSVIDFPHTGRGLGLVDATH